MSERADECKVWMSPDDAVIGLLFNWRDTYCAVLLMLLRLLTCPAQRDCIFRGVVGVWEGLIPNSFFNLSNFQNYLGEGVS